MRRRGETRVKRSFKYFRGSGFMLDNDMNVRVKWAASKLGVTEKATPSEVLEAYERLNRELMADYLNGKIQHHEFVEAAIRLDGARDVMYEKATSHIGYKHTTFNSLMRFVFMLTGNSLVSIRGFLHGLASSLGNALGYHTGFDPYYYYTSVNRERGGGGGVFQKWHGSLQEKKQRWAKLKKEAKMQR